MAFHLAHGTVVYRTTPLHGYSAIEMVERFGKDHWELTAALPRDTEEITAESARETVGAAADEPSRFAVPPEDAAPGGLYARVEQLDSMIEATMAWLRVSAVGTDTELEWASYQSADYDYELDMREALRDAASLLSQMVRHRNTLAIRNEIRDRKRDEED
ncbi:hypothetical protein [Kibdelosporangium phytohabitans]|uniref:Uncharacterized protein n=1 Tax=Kibdelosporangium phytohabitans TaxID=860235 RepID=A0A0N9HX64_9PSEU|nr:hypothetical protein [Kibdelosporangium phytohabitans]ALG10001.1 hypothetical protein AOZ06_26630 [Kibdelosporangium phytohabitans]MBE1468580.1 hypothetical protein [Kibdelosporangium phytohabitans]